MAAILEAIFGPALTRLAQAGIPLIIAAALALGAMALGWKAADILQGIIVDRVAAAVSERNAYWQGQIDKANGLTNKQAADQVRAAMQAQATASETVQSATQLLASLKVTNEKLPSADKCGLSAERSRLLPD